MRIPRDVYVITHKVTGRQYVGSSYQPEQRFKSHLWALRRGQHHIELMQKDFDEFGENYDFQILETIYEFKDKTKEYEWMKKLESHVTGYNYKDKAMRFFVARHERRQ